MSQPSSNQGLIDWVAKWEKVFQPDRVHWCDGSEAESNSLSTDLVA